MPRYEFSLSSPFENARLAGAVTGGSFEEALDAIAKETRVNEGDMLEIGVRGFPPARYQLVWTAEDGVTWRPEVRWAA
ncbi:MAG TPA: hypothetical protein VF041_02925 [Gemmatimonadaceae bacterium]